MTNPNNAIGTNGAYGGRTSVDAFNDVLASFASRGVISGFAISPNSGLTVSMGGSGTSRDVAIAEDNIGNKTTINNINKVPISITISGAPVNNSRIDSIVAYVEKPAQGSSTAVDNPGACGLIVVEGAVAGTPVAPNESAIRTAITSDGASGTTAYYVVLGNITIASGTTTITSDMITQGTTASFQTALTALPDNSVSTSKVQDAAITSSKIDWATIQSTTTERVVGTWEDGSTIYEKAFNGTVADIPNRTLTITTLQSGGVSAVVQVDGYFGWTDTHIVPIGEMTFFNPSANDAIFTCILVNNNDIQLRCFAPSDYTNRPYSVVVRYLKTG